MRVLLLLAVVTSARSQVLGWSVHNAPDNDGIIPADRESLLTPRSKVLSLSRLLFSTRGDIYQTLPELAQLYRDSEGATVDWRSRVDPTTDTEPWSRTDIGSDAELEPEPLCKVGSTLWSPCHRSSDTSLDYDSSSSLSLGLSPTDDNDEMKPVIRPSQLKRKQQSTKNRYVGRAKREAVPMETDTQEEAEKRSSAFNSWGGKRGSGFNSWGGKRNPPFSVLGTVRRRAFTSTGSSRSPAFSSWGGKRSQSFSIVGERRMNSWGGNSNPSLTMSTSDDIPAFSILGSKRPASFSSWGGKRDAGFSSWGGKRDPAFTILGGHHNQAYREPAFRIIGGGINEPAFTIVNDNREPAFKILGNHDFPAFSILGNSYEPSFRVLSSKRSSGFSSWGGKRDPAFNSWGGKRDPVFKSWGGKRDAAFSSWGGKRGSGFSSWGGKRDAAFSSWGGKRDDDSDVSESGSKFSSWGGKRDLDVEEKRSFSSWGGKRDISDSPKRGFSSWGGKRRVATQTDFENHHENGTGSNDVVGNGLSDADKEKEETEMLEKEKAEEYQDMDNEADESGRKHASTQTSSDFQQFLDEFDNKMQLEDNQEKEDENKEVNGENEGQAEEIEHKSEDENKADINMDQEPLATEDKSVGTTHTEEKSIGTSDSLSISKRLDRSEGRVSKALFSSWGGKRVSHSPSLFSILGSMHKGLGRSDGILSDFLYKRGSTRHSALGSKKWGQSSVGAVFSSWGGKRSDKGNNLRKISSQNLGRQYRRGAEFYSWGGKR